MRNKQYRYSPYWPSFYLAAKVYRQDSSVCSGRRAPEIELIEAEELGSSLVIHLHVLWNSDASATVSLFTPTCPANVFQSPLVARTQILGLIPLSQICKWQTLKVFVKSWPGHFSPTWIVRFLQICRVFKAPKIGPQISYSQIAKHWVCILQIRKSASLGICNLRNFYSSIAEAQVC